MRTSERSSMDEILLMKEEIDLEIKSRLFEAFAISTSKWKGKGGLFSFLFGREIKKIALEMSKMPKIEIERKGEK